MFRTNFLIEYRKLKAVVWNIRFYNFTITEVSEKNIYFDVIVWQESKSFIIKKIKNKNGSGEIGVMQKILEPEGRGNWRSLIFSLVSGDVPYYSSIPVSNLWVSYWKENCQTLTEYFLHLPTPSTLLLFIFLHFFYMTTEVNSVHLYCLADSD